MENGLTRNGLLENGLTQIGPVQIGPPTKIGRAASLRPAVTPAAFGPAAARTRPSLGPGFVSRLQTGAAGRRLVPRLGSRVFPQPWQMVRPAVRGLM
jgi:hypothetical protein